MDDSEGATRGALSKEVFLKIAHRWGGAKWVNLRAFFTFEKDTFETNLHHGIKTI